jgi:hypothetical protein
MGPLLNEATGGGVDVQGRRPGPLHSPDACDPSVSRKADLSNDWRAH